jgi:hypothetical protein
MRSHRITRIYPCWGGIFPKLPKMGRRDGKLLESVFLSICQKLKDREEGWQTVGVALRAISPVWFTAPKISQLNHLLNFSQPLFGLID